MTAKQRRPRLTWHPCPGISPDGRTYGYVCVNCGRQLEPWGAWWRHTNLYREQVTTR